MGDVIEKRVELLKKEIDACLDAGEFEEAAWFSVYLLNIMEKNK
jgi:hypothetical protein